jgi:hypothetical protein
MATMLKIEKSTDKKKMTKSELVKLIEKMRARDAEMVTGIFKNLECPNGSVSFPYCAYPDDPMEQYCLYDGERYTIPRGVARHLNNACFYKEYKHLKGEHGDTGIRGGLNDGRLRGETMQVAKKIHRFAFHSLEFMDEDIDMYPSNLVEVTTAS